MGAKMAALTGRVSGNIDLTVVFSRLSNVDAWRGEKLREKNYRVYLNKNSMPINKAGNDRNGFIYF